MNKQATLALTAAAACIAAAPAFGATSAGATFGPVQIELIDLDASDGITPSVSFWYVSTVTPMANRLQAEAMQSMPWAYQKTPLHGLTPWSTGSVDAAAGAAQAHAELTGNGDAAGTLLHASASASDFSGPLDGAYAYGLSDVLAPIGFGTGFELSANTRLIVSGEARVEGAGSWTGHGTGWDDHAGASVRLDIKATDGSQPSFAELSRSEFASLNGQHTFDFDDTEQLQVSFDNTTGDAVNGELTLVARASATTYATLGPVPEPATLALFGGGLVVVAAARRRRRG